MDPIRCLIADIPQKVLAEIVQQVVQVDENVEVVDLDIGIEELPLTFVEQPFNVLIVGMKNFTLPAVCEDLLVQYSNLLIVGIIEDGRKVSAYFNDVGSRDLSNLVTVLGRR